MVVKVTHRKDIRMVAKAGRAGTKTTPITRSDTPPPEGPANKISLGDFLDKEFIPVEIVDRLYDRLDPQKRTYPARISLPAHLKPFIDGYMRTRGCYTTHITPYTFRTAEEASRAIRNRTYLLNQQGAKKRYGRCLTDHFPSGLEKLGRIIGHQYWAPSLSVETNLQALFSGASLFNDVAHRIELLQSAYHHEGPKPSPTEKNMIISQLSYLSAHITNLVAAADGSGPDTKLGLSPELNQAIAALVHILEKHPSTISFFLIMGVKS